MKRIFGLVLALLMLAAPVWAADNITTKDGAGNDKAVRCQDNSSVWVCFSVLSGANGVSAWGTAGTANSNVLSVQGIASMTPLAVTGTFWQATQPVSGTFWQATQPVSIASVPSHAVTNAGTFAVQALGVGTMATAQVSVTNSATQVVAARTGRSAVSIQNHGTTAMFCGNSGVATSTGFRLPGVDGASITLPTSVAVFCITASGSQTVSALETY